VQKLWIVIRTIREVSKDATQVCFLVGIPPSSNDSITKSSRHLARLFSCSRRLGSVSGGSWRQKTQKKLLPWSPSRTANIWCVNNDNEVCASHTHTNILLCVNLSNPQCYFSRLCGMSHAKSILFLSRAAQTPSANAINCAARECARRMAKRARVCRYKNA
jgi:hypothetical protein